MGPVVPPGRCQSGRCIATSAWEIDEDMRASGEQVTPIRDRAVEMFAGKHRPEGQSAVFSPSHGRHVLKIP